MVRGVALPMRLQRGHTHQPDADRFPNLDTGTRPPPVTHVGSIYLADGRVPVAFLPSVGPNCLVLTDPAPNSRAFDFLD